MAIKATIYKARLEISDLDRQLYSDHELTIASHPSETNERLMVRLLAFALNVPPNEDEGALEFGRDMWEHDEPCLCRKDLTGQIVHWIDLGLPDEKRLSRAASRSRSVSIYSYASSTPIWWKDLEPKLPRVRNLSVWQIPAAQSQSLAALAQRTMKLQVTVQDGTLWLGDDQRSLEATPHRLFGNP
jgi:uncharacterized protein YaeQ